MSRVSDALDQRVRIYELALHVRFVPMGLHPQLAIDVCNLLGQLPPRESHVAARSIGAAGCAEPLVAALMFTAFTWARARVRAGLLTAGAMS